jgi:hypothetical protein
MEEEKGVIIRFVIGHRSVHGKMYFLYSVSEQYGQSEIFLHCDRNR